MAPIQLNATIPADDHPQEPVEGVATETPQYYCLLTEAGAALEAAALAASKPVRLTAISVGDGNGAVPTPESSATTLVNEVYRKAIDSLSKDEEDQNICWAHIVIPATEGGFWIREFGVWAEPLEEGGEPVLYAYGNHAPFYKLKSVLGQATTHELSVPIIISSTAEVEVVVSEAGYASRLEHLQLAHVVEDLRTTREAVWTLETELPSGQVLTLPEGMEYVPGKHLLDVFCDSVNCYPGVSYEEVPLEGTSLVSSSIRMLFDVPKDSEMRVLIRGYSLQPKLDTSVDVPEGLMERVETLETTLADVRKRAVYVGSSN